MFAPRYFAPNYFAPRYFPPGAEAEAAEEVVSVNIGGAAFVEDEERRKRRKRAYRPRYDYGDAVIQTYQIPEPQGEMVARVVEELPARRPKAEKAEKAEKAKPSILGLLDARGVPIEATPLPAQKAPYGIPAYPILDTGFDEDEELALLLLML